MEYTYNFKVISEGEAIASYRQAKNKKDQIGVLADLLICSKEAVKALLVKHGEELPAGDKYIPVRYKRWTDEDLVTAKKMFEDGRSLNEISCKLERNPGCVRKKLNENGCSFKKRNAPEGGVDAVETASEGAALPGSSFKEIQDTLNRNFSELASWRHMAAAFGCDSPSAMCDLIEKLVQIIGSYSAAESVLHEVTADAKSIYEELKAILGLPESGEGK